jgi:hypothetical protein
VVSSTTTAVPIPKKINDSTYEWIVTELDNKEPIITVPDNTVVFLTESSWITVQPTIFDAQHPFRILPPIVYNEGIDAKLYELKAQEMACVSMDFRPFHKKPPKKPCALANSQTVIQLPVTANQYRAS